MPLRIAKFVGLFAIPFLFGASCAPPAQTAHHAAPAKYDYLSPVKLLPSADKTILYAAENSARRIDFVAVGSAQVLKSVALPDEPTGMALSRDGGTLYVTCFSADNPEGCVCVIDVASGDIQSLFPAGHSPRSPVLSADEKKIYICNQFKNSVAVYDLSSKKKLTEILLVREPYCAAITPNGADLIVANRLPYGRSDLAFKDTAAVLSASVSIINTASGSVSAVIPLSDGCHSLNGIAVSPDGSFAYVSLVNARYRSTTTTIEYGWLTTNGICVIDIKDRKLVNTVLLDNVRKGFANPWDVVCADDKVFITAAGTDELCILDEFSLLKNLGAQEKDLSKDYSFARKFKKRISLSVKGPRAVAVMGKKAYVAGYFSDDIDIVDLEGDTARVTGHIGLFPDRPLAPLYRRGDALFSDAAISTGSWQSCFSCHPDGRMDGLTWDLINDGIGNPKNVKSLLLSPLTPPCMASGIRADAQVATRSGIKYILFAEPREADIMCIYEYLKSLKPVKSPHLINGQLSPSAKRGEILFGNLGCSACHPSPLYTDLKMHTVDSRGIMDDRDDYDTPSLVEVWRTSPYLHDGRFLTIEDLVRSRTHVLGRNLSKEEIADLVEFILSL